MLSDLVKISQKSVDESAWIELILWENDTRDTP